MAAGRGNGVKVPTVRENDRFAVGRNGRIAQPLRSGLGKPKSGCEKSDDSHGAAFQKRAETGTTKVLFSEKQRLLAAEFGVVFADRKYFRISLKGLAIRWNDDLN